MGFDNHGKVKKYVILNVTQIIIFLIIQYSYKYEYK